MDNMFVGCTSLKTIPTLNIQQVKSTSSMFAYCSNIEDMPFLETPNLNECTYMFFNCINLKNIPININNISKNNYKNIILGCKKLNIVDAILFLEQNSNNDFKRIILNEINHEDLKNILKRLY